MNHIYLGDEKKVYLCEYICENSRKSLVILPNIGWYHVGPNRIFPNLAKLCNDEQINMFCFDYIGTGESYGTYEDLTYENMKQSFLDIYKYIQQKYGTDIYVMGYGAGNIILKDVISNLSPAGVIYYLPRFENVLQNKKEVLNDVIARKNGYFNIQITKNPSDFLFWRSILGEIHDCTYNPIPYLVVKELCDSLERSMSKDSYAGRILKIEDSEIKDYQKYSDYLVIPEFKENIVPAHWYKKCNLWPDTLLRVNLKIVEWLKKFTAGIGEKCEDEIVSGKTFTTEYGTREIVSFDSGGKRLFGILHIPVNRTTKAPCIIFIPGLGGDKVDNFMCGPRLAESASRNGIAMFRYDNRYSGASDSPLTEYTNTGIFEDFENAYYTLRHYNDVIDLNNCILVSWSNGAKLSSYIVSQKKFNVKMCIFWNAVFFDANIEQKYNDRENMGKNLTRYKKNGYGQLVTQIGGEYLSMQYNRDNKKYDFVDLFQKVDVPKKYIWGDYDMDSREFEYISENEKNASSYCLSSKHHLFSYESLDEVIEVTIDFINKEINVG